MSQCQKEADDRNAILILKHGKIPSYGLWMENDIRKESLNVRLDWWKDSPVKNHELTTFWLDKLEKRLKIRVVNTEFCAKRMGNELYCDI